MKTKNYYLKLEEIALSNLAALKAIHEMNSMARNAKYELKQKYIETHGDGGFMAEAMDTPYDNEIAEVSAICQIALDAINNLEYLIKNPETADLFYDGAPS